MTNEEARLIKIGDKIRLKSPCEKFGSNPSFRVGEYYEVTQDSSSNETATKDGTIVLRFNNPGFLLYDNWAIHISELESPEAQLTFGVE